MKILLKKMLSVVFVMGMLGILVPNVQKKVMAITMDSSNGIYYVSSSSGDDSYDGLAPSWDGTHGPWKTLSKVGTGMYSAGDKILLKGGDTWNEQLTINSHGNKISYGTAQNPIEISSYGIGDKPKILRDLPTDMNQAQFCIQIFEASGWKITNLEIGRATFGIDFHYSTQDNSYIFIENCYFHDVAYRNMYGPAWMNEYGFSSAIQISGERAIDLSSPYVSDITRVHSTTLLKLSYSFF